MVSSIVVGTPVAVPLSEPKLLVRSLRTMPSWVSTFGPFEPSPGYGPAVSSGIASDTSTLELAMLVLVVVEEEVVDDEEPELVDAPAAVLLSDDEHPMRAAAPTPPSMVSARRRVTNGSSVVSCMARRMPVGVVL